MSLAVARTLGLWFLAGASATGLAGQALAQPTGAGRLLLKWSAPAECPSLAELHATIARLLGGTVYLPAGRTIAVKAVVTQGQTWQLDLETGSEAQRRTLRAESCAELAEATALIVALMVDARVVSAPQGPTRPPSVAVARAPAALDATSSSLRLGLLGAAAFGILPGLDAGIGGSLALVYGAWRFDLRVSYGLSRDQTVTAATPPGAFGSFNYTGATAGVCRNIARVRIELGACADVEVGVLSAHGHNVTEELSARTAWLGVGPAGFLALRAGRLTFPVRAALLLPLVRPEFMFNHVDGSVYRVASLSGKVSVGAELHF